MNRRLNLPNQEIIYSDYIDSLRNVFSGEEDGVKGENSDLFIPLFIYMNFRRRKKDELKIIPDEIPEDVKNYLLNSSIFEGNEELYNDAIIGKGKNK